MIKLAVLDVDGTLTESDRRLTPELFDAIPAVQERGTTISLVSGNVIPVMYALKTYLGVNGPVFGENGGVLLIDERVETFFSRRITDEFYRYISERIDVKEILTNRWRETSVAFSADTVQVKEVLDDLPDVWKDKIEVVDSRYAWHIMSRGQSKAFAINKLKEIYSLDDEEVLVCGDSDNDFSMYEVPSVKAALKNSTERIKAESEYVSDYAHGKGVVDIFRHFGLL